MKREPETNYTTPFVWADAQPAQLIVPATKRTVAYDLAGKEVWSFTGSMSALTICMPLAAHGLPTLMGKANAAKWTSFRDFRISLQTP